MFGDTALSTGRARRAIFISLVTLTTLGALTLLAFVFQEDGTTPLEMLLLVLYGALFAWVCVSFWTAAIGFLVCLLPSRAPPGDNATAGADAPIDADFKTAIVMPIYNEDAGRVFAGLRAMYQSLLETGHIEQFDFYVLSDSSDPDAWVEEELRWLELCHNFDVRERIFYRNRIENTGRKSGNIADFCRRWGAHYRYMIVTDADSVMSGETLVEMVRRMQRNPRAALIQVPPLPVNRSSLFARVLQFASGVYGRIFTAGLNYLQLGDANYWGHNAIVRIEPFRAHCGLPTLPGKEPFGGEILSHDFVEAALLRRAGWELWLAHDLGGSYEEIPPTLIDYAKRDRRWCQGNLQHSRLVFARGFRPYSRVHLLMGVMSYVASPLWLVFLVLTGVEAYLQSRNEPVYFFGDNLFPDWPVSYAVEMTTVLTTTLTMLFLPKLLGLILVLKDRETLRRYGGGFRASLSVLLETLFSMLLAPVLMLFQSKFVGAILMRRNIRWSGQQRDDHRTSFKDAVAAHADQTLLGVAAGILAYVYVPTFFWWFTPVLAGLVLAVPVSTASSSTALGRAAQRAGLFITPEESEPPRVLRLLHDYLSPPPESVRPASYRSHFVRAIVEPSVNALHVSLLPIVTKTKRRAIYLEGLIYQLLEDGVESLKASEKRQLLSDKDTMLRLHTMGWSLPDMEASFGPPAGAEA